MDDDQPIPPPPAVAGDQLVPPPSTAGDGVSTAAAAGSVGWRGTDGARCDPEGRPLWAESDSLRSAGEW